MAHTSDSAPQEVKEREWVHGQPKLYGETMVQKKKKNICLNLPTPSVKKAPYFSPLTSLFKNNLVHN